VSDPYHQNTTELAARLSGPSARKVCLPVRLRIRFGGVENFVGWFFFGAGLAMAWAIALRSVNPLDNPFDGTDLETAQAVVTHVKVSRSDKGSTSATVKYRFQVQDKVVEGTSYTRGAGPKEGARRKVEYRPDQPEISRLQGMRHMPFPAAGWTVALFPLAGWILLVRNWLASSRQIELLRRGRIGQARLVSKEPTSTRVNKQRVYRLTFEFTTQEGETAKVTTRTHQSEHLEDQQDEPLLYDPQAPWRACLLDAMPSRPRVESDGTIRLENRLHLLAVLITPALALLGNGIYLLIRWTS
jgi:hypothetical protein